MVAPSVYASMAVNRVRIPEVEEYESRVEPIESVLEDHDPMTYFVGKYLNLMA